MIRTMGAERQVYLQFALKHREFCGEVLRRKKELDMVSVLRYRDAGCYLTARTSNDLP